MENNEKAIEAAGKIQIDLASQYKRFEDLPLVMANLCDFCGMMQSNVRQSEGKIDPYQLARLEGRREVYLHIMAKMSINILQLQEMIKKQKEEHVRAITRHTS